MSVAYSTSNHSLHPHKPMRTQTADSGKVPTCPPNKLRVDQGSARSSIFDGGSPDDTVIEEDARRTSIHSELDESRLDDEMLAEALLDEASDIEVHPDELSQPGRFVMDSNKICDLARRALHQSPYKELHRLNLSVADDRIKILGQTTSFFLKQMAQEVVRQATPDLEIENLIGVRHLPHHGNFAK